jgi:hypothetical protein
MSADPNSPSRDVLVRFFRERRPLPLAETAALLGWPVPRVEREAVDQEALLPGGRVGWSGVANWVRESWPLATLVAALGPDSGVLPMGLHPIPLLLEQPAYIVTALRAQWHLEPMAHRVASPATFDEYMADLLHRSLQPETIASLSGDRGFLRALHFPEDQDDV